MIRRVLKSSLENPFHRPPVSSWSFIVCLFVHSPSLMAPGRRVCSRRVTNSLSRAVIMMTAPNVDPDIVIIIINIILCSHNGEQCYESGRVCRPLFVKSTLTLYTCFPQFVRLLRGWGEFCDLLCS